MCFFLKLFRADPSQGGKRCLDVDECRQRPSPCDHECTNTFGSYVCSCPSGYRLHERSNALLGSGSTCIDVDECLSKGLLRISFELLICTQAVTEKMRQQYSISHVVDLAETNNCEYECLNIPGSYECVCPRGFSQLGHRCLDIDECVEQQVTT